MKQDSHRQIVCNSTNSQTHRIRESNGYCHRTGRKESGKLSSNGCEVSVMQLEHALEICSTALCLEDIDTFLCTSEFIEVGFHVKCFYHNE